MSISDTMHLDLIEKELVKIYHIKSSLRMLDELQLIKLTVYSISMHQQNRLFFFQNKEEY